MYHELGAVKPQLQFPSKNNLTEPRPITSSSLKTALKDDTDLLALQISPKDEKILTLMVERGEEERTYWRKKLENALAWEKEKEVDDELKTDRDKHLQEKVKTWRDDDRLSVKTLKTDKEIFFREKRKFFEREHQKAVERAKQAEAKQVMIREQRIARMKEREERYRARQEKNWWEVNQTRHSRKYNDVEARQAKGAFAIEKKKNQLIDEAFRLAFENQDRKEAITERQKDNETQQQWDLEALILDLDDRHDAARKNYDDWVKTRNQHIERSKTSREGKAKKANDERMSDWARDMAHRKNHRLRNEQLEKQAREAVSQTLEDVANRARKAREEKQTISQHNVKKIHSEVERWKKQVAADIRVREKHMSLTQQERRDKLEKTRKVAHDTRLLRNKVRERYGRENFDRKALQVQLHHKMGHKAVPQDWNTSLISLL